MGCIPLQPADTVKFPNRKLSWKPNIEKIARIALIALFYFREAIGKSWGLLSKVVLWLDDTMVNLISLRGLCVKERRSSVH